MTLQKALLLLCPPQKPEILICDYQAIGSKGNIFDVLYLDPSTSLQVKYSNKKIEFQDVIITSKEVNHWRYHPDTETKGRLTAKFDWDVKDDDDNTILLVKTVFKFINDQKDGNAVLKIKNFQKRTDSKPNRNA